MSHCSLLSPRRLAHKVIIFPLWCLAGPDPEPQSDNVSHSSTHPSGHIGSRLRWLNSIIDAAFEAPWVSWNVSNTQVVQWTALSWGCLRDSGRESFSQQCSYFDYYPQRYQFCGQYEWWTAYCWAAYYCKGFEFTQQSITVVSRSLLMPSRGRSQSNKQPICFRPASVYS